MKLQQHHKHFAIKCFAQFMTRTQVVKAFMGEFRTNWETDARNGTVGTVSLRSNITELIS